MAGKTSKGRKLGRNTSWCGAYKLGGREAINRKRRMRTTIRWQPNNAKLREQYESEFGAYQQHLETNARIRRLIDRAAA